LLAGTVLESSLLAAAARSREKRAEGGCSDHAILSRCLLQLCAKSDSGPYSGEMSAHVSLTQNDRL